ncbi:hypothetical protein [Sciscionella sediminilitoris]|uniref:hypothetical protein n=1 Tax=Sciscionella sediminilitoris TaxID=1445613 RepID=UPI000690B39B|nr:hypothetical protein [Sciscionella sp. SE31]
MHRALGEQGEHGGADITAALAASSSPAAPATALPRPPESGREPLGWTETAGTEARSESAGAEAAERATVPGTGVRVEIAARMRAPVRVVRVVVLPVEAVSVKSE